ncbi:MAG: DUF6599 family protein [Blastocatellia bacterium]
MIHRTYNAYPAVVLLILLAPLAIRGQQPTAASAQAIAVAPAHPLSELLPDRLAGFAATSEVKPVEGDLGSDQAKAFQEYRILATASRQYRNLRVDVFQTRNQFAAFGLFTYVSGHEREAEENIGSGGALVAGAAVFWKGSYFVRVAASKPARASRGATVAVARALANAIESRGEAVLRPALLERLPALQMIPGSVRYFLGPESLGAYVERGREMVVFPGDAEAVLAEYNQSAPADPLRQDTGIPTVDNSSSAAAGISESQAPLKLVIIEYHTPQFATDAFVSLSRFVESLTDEERNEILFQREGNYIVKCVNVRNRELAQTLMGSIQYPYTVKWLRNPLWPTDDPFRMEKTAQMLISTFGLLGLILLTVLLFGSAFGATVFLKRRKRQQGIFSDAGGMLRLEIDPFESTLLGLPPKRSEE